MEAKKQPTSSSFTNDLFGSTESSSSSSSSLFSSIFPHPSSQAHQKDYISSEETKKNYDHAIGRGSTIDYADSDGRSHTPKTDMSPLYQQEATQPCHLSSSIYYGGQDVYTNPCIKNTPGHSVPYAKEGEDDGRASRGNWWQGSLYY